ncbi:MAG: multidrug resistance efflux pump [Candidatus Krumholzibacteriia bacterium]|jgi:multidrug resistance efflux pump
MSNAEEPTPPPADAPPTKGQRDPVRLITLIVLAVCVVMFIWYVRSDRVTPYTSQARLQTLLIPVVPRVSGHITEIGVRLHSNVEPGDVLFQLDRRPFDLAVRSSEAKLDQTTIEMGVQGASVKATAGQLGVARAQLDRAQRNYDRTQSVLEENPGALSLADKDRSETGLAQALERVSSSEANLEKAQQQLGVEGPENADLRLAVTAVEQAHLDLEYTTLRSPARGVIESFSIDVGHYAQAGQPLATFVSSRDVWIQADMRENNLSNIKAGNSVEYVLDVAPGRVFTGTVRSVGYGVSTGGAHNRGELPTVGSTQSWLREPQRFPVIIDCNDKATEGLLRAGAQVDVIIYTDPNSILNPLGRLNIRVRSWLSYVR